MAVSRRVAPMRRWRAGRQRLWDIFPPIHRPCRFRHQRERHRAIRCSRPETSCPDRAAVRCERYSRESTAARSGRHECQARRRPVRAAVGVQHEQFKRIAEIIMVELIVADSMRPHRRAGRDQEVEGRAQRPLVGKRRGQAIGRDRTTFLCKKGWLSCKLVSRVISLFYWCQRHITRHWAVLRRSASRVTTAAARYAAPKSRRRRRSLKAFFYRTPTTEHEIGLPPAAIDVGPSVSCGDRNPEVAGARRPWGDWGLEFLVDRAGCEKAARRRPIA